MKTFNIAAFLFTTLLASASAQAADTNVTIAAKAKDALFIGDSVGGAYIIVRDKRDDDILVEGRTTGGSGNSVAIMDRGARRDALIRDDKSAHFSFSLDLYEPTPVTIEVSGPYSQMQSLVKANAEYLLLPGKDYTKGNGIIIELPGFIVDVINPPANRTDKFSTTAAWPIQANITKLSGTQIEKSSPWPPERYDVEVSVYRGDLFLSTVKMEKTDQPGIYGANVRFEQPGTYRAVVTAFDPITLEGGMDSTTITLEP